MIIRLSTDKKINSINYMNFFIHLSGIEENEQLYARVRELEGRSGLSAARERGRSFDSLSDLTNIDMDLDLSELDKER